MCIRDRTDITIKGIDKAEVGNYAAVIRQHRKPEPYKGKGIKLSLIHICYPGKKRTSRKGFRSRKQRRTPQNQLCRKRTGPVRISEGGMKNG